MLVISNQLDPKTSSIKGHNSDRTQNLSTPPRPLWTSWCRPKLLEESPPKVASQNAKQKSCSWQCNFHRHCWTCCDWQHYLNMLIVYRKLVSLNVSHCGEASSRVVWQHVDTLKVWAVGSWIPANKANSVHVCIYSPKTHWSHTQHMGKWGFSQKLFI